MTSNRRRIAAQRKQAASGRRIQAAEELEFVAVARLRRPHGLQGEVLAEILSDFPERIIPQAAFFLGPERHSMTVKSVRQHNDGLLLTFEEISSREAWQGRQNQYLYAPIAELADLEADEHYHHELIGLRVVDEGGKDWGRVSEILQTGANDVYVLVDAEGRERLVPATTQVVKEIDVGQGLICIELIPGIFD